MASRQKVATMPSPTPAAAERFEMLPWRQLMESKHNSRKTFNQHKLEELAASIRDRGIITPLIVRPTDTARAIIAAAFWEPGLQEYFNVEYSGKDIWEMFTASLKRTGVDFKDIEGQVRAELAEAAKKKSGKGAGK